MKTNHRHPQHPTVTDGPESCPEQAFRLNNDAAVNGSYGSWIAF